MKSKQFDQTLKALLKTPHMKKNNTDRHLSQDFKKEVYAYHKDLYETDKGYGGSIAKRVRERFNLSGAQIQSIILEMGSTTEPAVVVNDLPAKLELSPFKAGMVGTDFDNPIKTNGYFQVSGSDPIPFATEVVKRYNSYHLLGETVSNLGGINFQNKQTIAALQARNTELVEALKLVMEDLKTIACNYAGYSFAEGRKTYYGNLASYAEAKAVLDKHTKQ